MRNTQNDCAKTRPNRVHSQHLQKNSLDLNTIRRYALMTAPLHRASQIKLETQTVKEKEEKQQAKETAIVSLECPRDVAGQHTTKQNS